MNMNMNQNYDKRTNFFNPPIYDNFKNNKKQLIYSAGILPYQVNENNKIYFLLGKDADGNWSDFGGKCEPKDRNNIQETAAREFFEESLNSVINLTSTRNLLKNKKNYTMINSKSLAGSSYYMFILRVPMIPDTAKDRFQKTLEYLRFINADYQYMEKVDIGWISLDTLLLILDNSVNEKVVGWKLRKVFKKTLIRNLSTILSELKNKHCF